VLLSLLQLKTPGGIGNAGLPGDYAILYLIPGKKGPEPPLPPFLADLQSSTAATDPRLEDAQKIFQELFERLKSEPEEEMEDEDDPFDTPNQEMLHGLFLLRPCPHRTPRLPGSSPLDRGGTAAGRAAA